jgi:3-hydroxyisobutyrate dehydrogenase
MGTISPKESLELAQLVEGAGGFFLEAPVLGSVGQAQEGSLEVMVAGKEELFRRWQALLQCFGTVTYLGPLGKATTLKLALNNLIASLAVAFATSLWLVERGGVSREVFLQILRRSALYAPTFDRKLPLLLDPTSGPVNFPTRHMLKDLRLISETARELRLAANLPETLVSLFAQALEAGWADADYAAVSWVIAGKPAPSSAKT